MGKENPALLCELLAARGELLKSLEGLRVETAWKRPEPNEWSTVEVLHHVADVNRLQLRRFDELRQGKPDLSGYQAAEWEKERAEAEEDGLPGVLLRLCAAHMEVLETVSGLGAADLERTSRHARYGPMTGRQLVEMLIRHDRDHAQQIAKTRAAVEV